ncbi:ornithine cyclodeaminase family protein [Halopenitus persicus]|uniref:Alanine dehydrogenase n=1 Tax=Halopenitus persicus TaxID=1048396 RepID=A0A1H3GX21_9EURY|nr:ornithine cyclodeaminase family protein [Halopenitus persicus]SDY07873.1 alanine dehydrogenase [Halopenitus persicus]
MRVLSDDDVASVLDLEALLEVVDEAFRKQGRGEVERPDRPHFPVGTGLTVPAPEGSDDGELGGSDGDESGGSDGGESGGNGSVAGPFGTALVMPAYVHGAETYATKLAAVHENNPGRGLETVNATIALTDAATGLPVAYLSGSRITNARTGCIGGVAARALATDGPVTLGVIGAGRQARWQVRAIDAATDLDRVRVYSPSDSRNECAETLRSEGIDATAVDSPRAAVAGATVVVTATPASEPVFDGADLEPGALVVAIGAYDESMRELDAETIRRADRLFGDVPSEAAHTGDIPDDVTAADLTPLSAALEGTAGRGSDAEVIVVESVGSAVLDAAAAEHLYTEAQRRGVGRDVDV